MSASTIEHTCASQGSATCVLCMQFEAELWGRINDYAITVGGDPSRHVYGNMTRMQAVADVNKIIARVRSRQQIDDLTVEELAKGNTAAAAAAGKFAAEADRLRAVLMDVRGFLRGVARRPELGRGAKDLLDEAEALDRVLSEARR